MPYFSAYALFFCFLGMIFWNYSVNFRKKIKISIEIPLVILYNSWVLNKLGGVNDYEI